MPASRRLDRDSELPYLVALYEATNGASWSMNSQWLAAYACVGTAPTFTDGA